MRINGGSNTFSETTIMQLKRLPFVLCRPNIIEIRAERKYTYEDPLLLCNLLRFKIFFRIFFYEATKKI